MQFCSIGRLLCGGLLGLALTTGALAQNKIITGAGTQKSTTFKAVENESPRPVNRATKQTGVKQKSSFPAFSPTFTGGVRKTNADQKTR